MRMETKAVYVCAAYQTEYPSSIERAQAGNAHWARDVPMSALPVPVRSREVHGVWQKAMRGGRLAVGWEGSLHRQWKRVSHWGGLIRGCLFVCPFDVKLVFDFVASKEAPGKGRFSSSKPWESNTFILTAFPPRTPCNILAFPSHSYPQHNSCSFYNDLPAREWLKEPIYVTWRSCGTTSQEVIGEEWGQNKQG